ncbi:unnamed protein product [Discosporangium mesarthrocarpum]
MTTCKRLELFRETVESLKVKKDKVGEGGRAGAGAGWGAAVCDVIVVDDSSGVEDQAVMLREFPEFTFVFKGSKRKGHADSMNLILALTTTRYLFYVEDDWLAVPGRAKTDFLDRALEVLQSSEEEVAQVLINDQSSRACAYADLALCPSGSEGTSAGWPRVTPPHCHVPLGLWFHKEPESEGDTPQRAEGLRGHSVSTRLRMEEKEPGGEEAGRGTEIGARAGAGAGEVSRNWVGAGTSGGEGS